MYSLLKNCGCSYKKPGLLKNNSITPIAGNYQDIIIYSTIALCGTTHANKAKQTCSDCHEAAFGIFQQECGTTERLGRKEHLLSQVETVARGMPGSASPEFHLIVALTCTVPPRHCGLITIQQCQPFWNAPDPPVTTRQHLKNVLTSIFPKDDFFFLPPPCEWVELSPGRALEADIWEGS